MELKEIKTVGIAGAGTMGAGIALVCAQASFKVILFDINQTVLDSAQKSNLSILKKMLESSRIDQNLYNSTLDNITYSSNISNLKEKLKDYFEKNTAYDMRTPYPIDSEI